MPGKDDTPVRLSQGLTVITTHMNADFDAFASMLAAKKLYPDALVVFPGSQEKNLRDFFVKSMVYMYDIVKIKDIDLKKGVIFVRDSKNPNRALQGDYGKDRKVPMLHPAIFFFLLVFILTSH